MFHCLLVVPFITPGLLFHCPSSSSWTACKGALCFLLPLTEKDCPIVIWILAQVVLNTHASHPLLLELAGDGVADNNSIEQQQLQQQQLSARGLQLQQEHQRLSAPLQPRQLGEARLVDSTNMYGLTALHVAVCYGRVEATNALLEVRGGRSQSSH